MGKSKWRRERTEKEMERRETGEKGERERDREWREPEGQNREWGKTETWGEGRDGKEGGIGERQSWS